jgi:hypothetical protein
MTSLAVPSCISMLKHAGIILEVPATRANVWTVWNDFVSIAVELNDRSPVAEQQAVALHILIHLRPHLLSRSAATAAVPRLDMSRCICHAAKPFACVAEWALNNLLCVRPNCEGRHCMRLFVLCSGSACLKWWGDARCCWSEFSLARRLP